MRLFCFGFGYVAQHLAVLARSEGWDVQGTSRIGSAETHAFNGYVPMNEVGRNALREATHVLISIPPDAQGDVVLRHHGDDFADADWVGYLSTTGVYGDWQGEWVDEDSALRAKEPRSVLRIKAEEAWLAASDATRVFRLSGIYGEGRNAIKQMQEGNAHRIYKEGQYFSRIHVVDIARLLWEEMHRGGGGKIYNLADAQPAPSHEVVAEAARLLGVEAPPLVPFEEANLSPFAASFYAANRRVDGTRILRDLQMELCYPTYKEGLKSFLPPESEGAADA
ncbi:MAG: SDR family oxidoreductase [Alphaproteobacteria bacterium]|nr:SDR family oxidoreductase [Alphaproteobacteria bacterium]